LKKAGFDFRKLGIDVAAGTPCPCRQFQYPAALIPWNMPNPVPQSPKTRRRALASCVVALCWLVAACDSGKKTEPATQAAAVPVAIEIPELALARTDLAREYFANGSPDKAAAILVAALEVSPECAEARDLLGQILAETRWHLPILTINHGKEVKIDRVQFSPPSSLWVGTAGNDSTLMRWNTETLAIERLFFPIESDGIRSLIVDAEQKFAVIDRAGIKLLCHAQTLKPIRDLGMIPDWVTPSSLIVFSPDGLLLAHPAQVSADDASLVWRLRDTSSGEILRSTDPIPADRPAPVAAYLDRTHLSVMHADGSYLTVPVSPVEPVEFTQAEPTLRLSHAQFSADGNSALVLSQPGPHSEPKLEWMSADDRRDPTLEPIGLLERFPWNRHPGIWSGLMKPSGFIKASENSLGIDQPHLAPLASGAAISAVAANGETLISGDEAGTVTFYQLLPLPTSRKNEAEAIAPSAEARAALKQLIVYLTGLGYDSGKRAFIPLPPGVRLESMKSCRLDDLLATFPDLDFGPLAEQAATLGHRSAPAEALQVLRDRISRSRMPAPDSFQELAKIFESGDDDAVFAAIKSGGKKGPVATKVLELALASTHAGWIEAAIVGAEDLPPLLEKLARSRIAWIQDRKADAIAGWPDVFPDLAQVRLREDWDGWEQADFGPALEKLRLCVTEELNAIEVPENSTPEQRKAVYERLTDANTVRAVGKARYAKACLKAALAFSEFKDETETTFRLASIARGLGEAAEPCLRAEALALTALGDYQKARERWVTLITEYPVANHLPGDYAEAAYTSFENADPRQAMEILTTGLHRFPNDANFALRAGWVALLTGNAERAYRFLLTGRQIGYPEDKLENATALMAIAAVQTGASEDATVLYQDLIRMDPAWENPETIETLEWPEELKSSLRQLAW
jgi:tetratricopeptide (TPR) repeat protein